MIRKIQTYFKRKKNAKSLGIDFERTAKFVLPQNVLINNKNIRLNLIDDRSTNTTFVDIFLDDTYGLLYFKKHFNNIKTIIDIGANQGLFTLAARNIFPSSIIHSYEPNQAIIKNLAHHCELVNATYFNEAVGSVTGLVTIKHGMDSLHGKTIMDNSGCIRQVTLKECISRLNASVDLLKLDCEGAEWEIFQNKESLKQVAAITMEYHLEDGKNHDSIKHVLADADFKILNYEMLGLTWGKVWAVNKKN